MDNERMLKMLNVRITHLAKSGAREDQEGNSYYIGMILYRQVVIKSLHRDEMIRVNNLRSIKHIKKEMIKAMIYKPFKWSFKTDVFLINACTIHTYNN